MSVFRRHAPHHDRPPPVADDAPDRDHLEAILAVATDLVTTVDRAGRLVYANPAADRVLRHRRRRRPATPGARPPRWAVERYQNEVQPALRAPGRWEGELALTCGTATRSPLSCVLVAHRDADGRIDRVSADHP